MAPMHDLRRLTAIVALVAVITVDHVRADPGALAQAPGAEPHLIEEVGRLLRRHFYDREAVERVWSQARAAHGTALSRGATGQEITATLDATLAALGASHTERYTSGELAYYELLASSRATI